MSKIKLTRKKKVILFTGVLLTLILVIICTVILSRESIFSKTSRNGGQYATPSTILGGNNNGVNIDTETPFPKEEADDEITKKLLQNGLYTGIHGEAFSKYSEYVDYYSKPVPEEIWHENMNLLFGSSSEHTEAPSEWTSCNFTKVYNLKIFIPENSVCNFTNYISESGTERTTVTSNKDIDIQVILQKTDIAFGNKVFALYSPEYEMKTLEVQGYKAVTYIATGAKGSAWRHLDIKLSNNEMLTFIIIVRPFDPKSPIDRAVNSEEVNNLLLTLTSSFEYE